MIKKIEILLIDISGRIIGIDSTEVKKVISDTGLKNSKKMIDNYKKDKKFISLGEIYKTKTENSDNSLIIAEVNEKDEYLVTVPDVSSIIAIDTGKIIKMPDFIKHRQFPFFVWGFYKNDDILISLITFTFFKDKV